MRLTLLTIMLCAGAMAADPHGMTEHQTFSGSHSTPKTVKSKRTFHPFGFLRRLGRAETEFAERLSSWGIQQDVDLDHAKVLQPANPSPVCPTLMAPESLVSPAQ